MKRPPILDEIKLSPEQQGISDNIRSKPRGLVEAPLRVWLESDSLAKQAETQPEN